MFAPDVDTGDRMSKDGLGATYVMDISDVARGVDGNSLSIRNLRKPLEAGERVDLIVRDLAVGWMDRGQLPQPPSLVPQRPPLKTAVRPAPFAWPAVKPADSRYRRPMDSNCWWRPPSA